MSDVHWYGLDTLDGDLFREVCKFYSGPFQFVAAWDDEEECSQMLLEFFGGTRPADELNRLVRRLLDWRASVERRVSLPRQVAEVVPRRPVKFPRREQSKEEIFSGLVLGSPALALEVLQKSIRQRKLIHGAQGENREALLREKWALVLAQYIEEAGLPCAARVAALPNPRAAWCRLFGTRRGKTLRNRALAWRKFHSWLEITFGESWPGGVDRFVKYLTERHDIQPMGKTVPSSLMAALSVLESVGQVPASSRFSMDQLLLSTIQSWTEELETVALPVRKAPVLTVAMVLSCELTVCRATLPAGLRFLAFVQLLMLWSTMRCDDVQHIDPFSVTLSQIGLKFILRRTKTSGPGRRTGELQGYVSRVISLSGFDWLLEGYRLLQTAELHWSRDYLCPAMDESWNVGFSYVEAQDLAVLLRRLHKELRVPLCREGTRGTSATKLLPGSVAAYWTGHSARHTLPTWALSLGADKSKCDFLGRWRCSQGGSLDYLTTARQIVQGLQNFVCKSLVEGTAEGGLIEEELFQSIQSFADAAGQDGTQVVMWHQVLEWTDDTWKLGGVHPLLAVGPERYEISRGRLEAELPAEDKDAGEEESSLPDMPFFVTISRSGFRRLHLSKACAVRQERCMETVGVSKISEGIADAICKLCQPKISAAQESSSSGSEDSLAPGNDGQGEPPGPAEVPDLDDSS